MERNEFYIPHLAKCVVTCVNFTFARQENQYISCSLFECTLNSIFDAFHQIMGCRHNCPAKVSRFDRVDAPLCTQHLPTNKLCELSRGYRGGHDNESRVASFLLAYREEQVCFYTALVKFVQDDSTVLIQFRSSSISQSNTGRDKTDTG